MMDYVEIGVVAAICEPMANSEQVVENDTPSSLIEQLGKALNELKARKDASVISVHWQEIELHFRNLDAMLKKKIEELESREKQYEEKEAETHAMLDEMEAEVVAKEQDLLDRVQDVKDAAVAVIAEARANHKPASSELVDDGDHKDSKVSSSLDDPNSPGEYSSHKMGENSEGVAVVVKPRPELTQYCEQMDAKGLLNFTMEHQKSLYYIRKELSVALENATDPTRLVLDTLEGFYPLVDNTQTMDTRDAALQGKRKSCVMFLEAMANLMARIDPGGDHLLNPEIKQQAKAIAHEWKPMLASADIDATNGNSLEADAFLQLLSTFRISSDFDEEELCKLVLVVAHRRHAPELCRSLGLIHKMPGVIESLVNGGKQIEAIRFIHAFQLTQSYPPVPLIKACLDDFRRSQEKDVNSGATAGSLGDIFAELGVLKAVIGCIEEFKLEADYPLNPLKAKVARLEKSKYEKKRAGDFGRNQRPKMPRANGGHRGFREHVSAGTFGGRHAPPFFADRTTYTGATQRYAHTVLNPSEYQAPKQGAYGQQVPDQTMYYYPQDNKLTAATYNTAPNYSSYMDTGTGSSSHQPYI